MATKDETKEKESRGYEFPKGTAQRLERARRDHGHRSVNALMWEEIVGPWLSAHEARSAKQKKEGR